MKTNITYKDSVFSFLFSDPDTLRELYSALEGVSLPPDTPVVINTLTDVLFMDKVNDISFEIGGKLVILIEHQSTINPNMALRLLMYAARVYEKIVEGHSLYKNKVIRLPRPEFFVLYNGTAPYPDEQVLKLSDMYESAASLGLPEKVHPALELEVKVLNINQGRNEGIVQRCQTLAGYSAFVMRVREYEKAGYTAAEAIKEAVIYCQRHDILKGFLEEHGSEVLSMLMTEWNWDDALAVRYEEGHEDGWEGGLEEGLEKGRDEEREEIARNALTKGIPLDMIHEITGLDMETIESLKSMQ